MITKEKAIQIAHNNMPDFTIRRVTETSRFYIIDMIPKGIKTSSIFMDGVFKIDKRNGKFEGYNPLIDD